LAQSRSLAKIRTGGVARFCLEKKRQVGISQFLVGENAKNRPKHRDKNRSLLTGFLFFALFSVRRIRTCDWRFDREKNQIKRTFVITTPCGIAVFAQISHFFRPIRRGSLIPLLLRVFGAAKSG